MSSQSLSRFHARAPRYVLDTGDNSLIRMAGPKQIPWEEGTNIKNVSLTGLAFTAPADLCPVLGEVIKIQFIPPGAKQIASHGIVTRIEKETTERCLVGIHFYKMEMAHRIALAQGLAQKIQSSSESEGYVDPQKWSAQLPAVFFLCFLLLIWLECFYLFIHFNYSGLFNLLRLIF